MSMPYCGGTCIEQGTRTLQVVRRRGVLSVIDTKTGEALAGVQSIVEDIDLMRPWMRRTQVTFVLEHDTSLEPPEVSTGPVVESDATLVPLSPLRLPRKGRGGEA